MENNKKEISGKDFLHWRAMLDNTHLRAELLKPGEDLIVTIKEVKKDKLTSSNGQITEKPVLYFTDSNILPMACNVTNCKILEKLFGTGNIYEWPNHTIQIFATTTRVAGESVPCLRVRNFLPKGSSVEYRCSVCGKVIDAHTYLASMKKYGKAYCSKECLDVEKNGKKVEL